MHTTGADPRHAFINPRDFRLLDMLDGARRPPEQPPPKAMHDFLVLNPHPDLAPNCNAPTRPFRSA